MSTPHTPASGLAEASAAFASALKGGASPAPAPTSSPEPSPEPAAPPPAEPPAAPAAPPAEPPAPPASGGGPAPTPPATPEPEPAPPAAAPTALDLQDPAARRFLEMAGGDPERALAKALRDNNRLAQLYKEHPELFRPGGPADPNAQRAYLDQEAIFEEPQSEAPSSFEPPQLDEAAVMAEVDQRVNQDPRAVGMIHEYATNQQRIGGIAQQKAEIQNQILYRRMKLEDPAFSADELSRPQIESEIFHHEQRLGLLEQQESRLELKNERLAQQFDAYRGQLYQGISQQMYEQAREEAYSQYEKTVESAEYQRAMKEWPAAISRCIADNKIPLEQVEDFKRDAAMAFQVAMADPNYVPQDMYAFLAPISKQIVERLDRYHRVRAGQYATLANARAATPSPPTAPPGAAAPQTTEALTPDEAMANATAYLRQRMR